MSDANRALEGVQFFVPGGVNERILPELVPKEDFSQLMGWIPNQFGRLVSAPGKSLLTRALQGFTILGVFAFGNYILVQTNTNLIRFSNFEIFGGDDFTNNLTPDIYPINLTANEEDMSQILLRYSVVANAGGQALTNNAWVQIPFNTEVRDTGGNCILAAGAFTLSSGAYPKNCRIDARVALRGSSAGANVPSNARLGLFVPAVSTTVPILYGLNERVVNPVAASRTGNILTLKDFFVLAASTVYDLRVFISGDNNASVGDPVNAGGLAEIYGQAEILFEP